MQSSSGMVGCASSTGRRVGGAGLWAPATAACDETGQDARPARKAARPGRRFPRAHLQRQPRGLRRLLHLLHGERPSPDSGWPASRSPFTASFTRCVSGTRPLTRSIARGAAAAGCATSGGAQRAMARAARRENRSCSSARARGGAPAGQRRFGAPRLDLATLQKWSLAAVALVIASSTGPSRTHHHQRGSQAPACTASGCSPCRPPWPPPRTSGRRRRC